MLAVVQRELVEEKRWMTREQFSEDWPVAQIIANLSTWVTLAAGDLIYTGTPAGVGALLRGDVLRAGVAGLPELHARII